MSEFGKYDTVEICSIDGNGKVRGFVSYYHKGLFTNLCPIYRRANIVDCKNKIHDRYDTRIKTCRMVLTEKRKKWNSRYDYAEI